MTPLKEALRLIGKMSGRFDKPKIDRLLAMLDRTNQLPLAKFIREVWPDKSTEEAMNLFRGFKFRLNKRLLAYGWVLRHPRDNTSAEDKDFWFERNGKQAMNNTDQAAELLLEKVSSLQGIKAVNLATEPEVARLEKNVPELLEQLVKDGKLVEVEYVLPYMQWRAKSFYLPAGTKVRLRNAEPECDETSKIQRIKELLESAEDYDVVHDIAKIVGADVTRGR